MSSKKVIFFAPNVHTGGGLTLLKSLIADVPTNTNVQFILDERARTKVEDILGRRVSHFFNSSLSGRWQAEKKLADLSCENTVVLCFHNLPPILNVVGKIKVFLQNRLLVDREHLGSHPMRVKSRLFVESILLKKLSSKVDEFLVQTQSMARHLEAYLSKGELVSIKVCPFFKFEDSDITRSEFVDDAYFYISSGDLHKNHINLLKTWKHLHSEHGLRLKLLLTVGNEYSVVTEQINLCKKQGLDVFNLGNCDYETTMATLARSKALIFPSYTESFGLPLVEATRLGVPIIASELDYVRDVCIPQETFDPNSPISIARAVLRFEGKSNIPQKVASPSKFWSDVSE
ncbi:glycosyltransferase [Vibrio mimicus]|uniref:glycosyltransferase n=1 Tax=Vibrio mimicus TaxID=674 RepID=UPI0011DABC86|nr:glycosyltransferase [Vibrio mimicus]TXY10345.1 glycosyltransferase family 4 protein [Vibrio mimicus]BCN22361.1 putative glycosyltransferase [Vibrio mimicus]BCN22520.1 putative glycosyltransferase [Vibrio mimicus]